MSALRISAVTVTPVAFADPPLLNSVGVHEPFGLGLSMHSYSHLGISLAAMVHLAAATPNLTYACDTHWPDCTSSTFTGHVTRVPCVPCYSGFSQRARQSARANLRGSNTDKEGISGMLRSESTGGEA